MEEPAASPSKIEQLEELLNLYTEISAYPLPLTVADAVQSGWNLAEVHGLPVASVIDRGARQRVMSMKTAMKLLEDYEEDFILLHCTARDMLIDRKLKNVWAVLTGIASIAVRAWETLIAIWDIGGLLLAEIIEHPTQALTLIAAALPAIEKAAAVIWAGWDKALAAAISAWGLANFAQSSARAFAIRESWLGTAEKMCYRQRQVSRVRRRKKTRR